MTDLEMFREMLFRNNIVHVAEQDNNFDAGGFLIRIPDPGIDCGYSVREALDYSMKFVFDSEGKLQTAWAS